MHLFNINLGPDKNPKPDRVKPEPDFGKRQKPDPSSNPTIQTRAGPEPDYLRPVASLVTYYYTEILTWKIEYYGSFHSQ